MQNDQTVVKKSFPIVEELVNKVKNHLDFFFDQVDYTEIQRVLDVLLSHKGTIFLTGVGKSGIIAKKIATTMSSCGTKALALSCLDALHGDIGLISSNDCVIMLSKSGQTEELLQLCPALRNKNATLIAVVSNKESRLKELCDHSVFLPIGQELCPYDIAPTTSTLVQLIFGDILAIALMRSKEFSLDEFMYNHPAGRIGKRLTLHVQDLMLKGEKIPLCSAEQKLVDLLVELSQKRCGCILVADSEMRLLGIFTDGDLRRALQTHGAKVLDLPISELMTKSPKNTAPTDLAYSAMKIMEQTKGKEIMVLPVLENEKIVGIIKIHDILQAGL